MTRFRRSSHTRTSKYGVVHRVSGSVVDRGEWDRGASRLSLPRIIARLDELHARAGVTSAFVNPNARCPVCGEPVFYYRRVFFDELGPPWPKHPCTDNAPLRGKARPGRPSIRPISLRTEIRLLRDRDHLDARAEFRGKYKRLPPRLFVVAKRIPAKRGLLLVLERLGSKDAQMKFCAIERRIEHLTEGSVVSRRGAELSFFDVGRMKPRKVNMTRIGSARAFIAEWLSASR
jgi:hypothetical protein